MIRAEFRYRDGEISGFSIKGHAGGVFGEDVVCAAVSSAAYMTANTLSDVCRLPVKATVKDGEMTVMLCSLNENAKMVLDGFLLHVKGLQEEYPTRIQLLKTEV